MELLPYFDLSAVGVFGLAMFFFLRHLVSQMRQDRKFMEDRLTSIINDYKESAIAHTRAHVEFTKTLAELYTWLKAKNGKG